MRSVTPFLAGFKKGGCVDDCKKGTLASCSVPHAAKYLSVEHHCLDVLRYCQKTSKNGSQGGGGWESRYPCLYTTNPAGDFPTAWVDGSVLAALSRCLLRPVWGQDSVADESHRPVDQRPGEGRREDERHHAWVGWVGMGGTTARSRLRESPWCGVLP